MNSYYPVGYIRYTSNRKGVGIDECQGGRVGRREMEFAFAWGHYLTYGHRQWHKLQKTGEFEILRYLNDVTFFRPTYCFKGEVTPLLVTGMVAMPLDN